MKTLKFYLDARDIKEGGKATIKFKITKNGKASYIASDIRVTKEQWNKKDEVIIAHPSARRLNGYLNDRYNEIADILLLNREEFAPLSAVEIAARVKEILNPSEKRCVMEEEKPKDLFIVHFERFMNTKQTRTYNIYKATMNHLVKFAPNLAKLRFSDIDKTWLLNFDKHLAKTSPSKNARNIHFRNIRAVFNDAIDEDVTTHYPFRKFKIKNEATVKRSFSIEQLAQLFNATEPEYAMKYLDIFKLSFYLIGINMIDLCNLKEIKDGRIEYHRAKTHRLYTIKVEPEALEIIKKYQGKKYLLYMNEHYTSYTTYNQKYNLGLRAIGKKLNKKYKTKAFSDITGYWARHTWATIAASLEIPKETIAKALGHGGNEVTDIYIRFDDKKIDEANRKVIDYVNNYYSAK